MKCGVVTVYNSENCGSFLQAYAMVKTLEKNGMDAVVVRQGFMGHSSKLLTYLKRAIKFALRGNFKGVSLLTQRRFIFKKACKKYFQIAEPSEPLDCYVLGSDVIWDVADWYFNKHYLFFWGMQFYPRKVISYAASVGFTVDKDLETTPFVTDALKKMSAVGVRDENSKRFLQPYCDKEIQIVCDPTFLLDREDYDVIAKPTDLDKFIFLYCYGNLPDADREAIQALAQKEGLKTVTFGNFNAWCDMNLAYDPLLFLSVYGKADYVITNTFHGTVFAVIYEKRFAVVKNDKQKVLNVLKMCDLSDKMIETAEDYTSILHSEFDYEMTRKNILQERANSLHYLSEALGERNTNG